MCQIFVLEGSKWLVTIISIALVHILHALVTENAVNVLHITAEVEKFRDVSFPNPAKKLMTDQ